MISWKKIILNGIIGIISFSLIYGWLAGAVILFELGLGALAILLPYLMVYLFNKYKKNTEQRTLICYNHPIHNTCNGGFSRNQLQQLPRV